jgi:recombinational DNA repair protein (RecF pathway)
MANNKMWLHCYNCGEQFYTEVGYYYSSKQVCGECRKPKPVEISAYAKRQAQGRAKRQAKAGA